MGPTEKIGAIIRERRFDLNRDDERQIEALLTELPLDAVHEIRPAVFEAIALIVMDFRYRGDIPLDE